MRKQLVLGQLCVHIRWLLFYHTILQSGNVLRLLWWDPAAAGGMPARLYSAAAAAALATTTASVGASICVPARLQF